MLGIVGGLVAIIVTTLQWTLGNFETFRLQNSLIRHFYWVSPQKNLEPKSEFDAKKSFLSTMTKRDKYWYNYHEFLFARCLRNCFCCCRSMSCSRKKLSRFDRHNNAVKLLKSELDIVDIIKTHRLAKFIAKT